LHRGSCIHVIATMYDGNGEMRGSKYYTRKILKKFNNYFSRLQNHNIDIDNNIDVRCTDFYKNA